MGEMGKAGERSAFQDRLREVMRDMGWGSQRVLAQEIGVPAATVAHWFGGAKGGRSRGSFPVKHLARIAERTGVSPTWLRFGTGPKFVSDAPRGELALATDMHRHYVSWLVAEGHGTEPEILRALPGPVELLRGGLGPVLQTVRLRNRGVEGGLSTLVGAVPILGEWTAQVIAHGNR